MRPYRYTQHQGKVYCLSYSPCGDYLATGGHDGKVFIWRTIANGNKTNFNFRAHGGPVKSVVYSLDGNFLVTAGDDKIIKLWRILNKGKAKFVRSFLGHTNWVLKADISPDARLIASICDKHVKIWEASSGLEFSDFRNIKTGNTCLEFHPDGNYVAIGGKQGLLQMLDLRTNKLAQVYDTKGSINTLSIHVSGQFVLCGFDYNSSVSNAVIKIFDLKEGRCIYDVGGVHRSIFSVRFSRDGQYFATGGADRLVYVWKTNFKPFKPLLQEIEQETIEVEEREKDVFIGSALNLEEHTRQQRSQKRANAYEGLTMTLEKLVSSVNTISQSLISLDKRLLNSEQKTDGIMKIIEFREMNYQKQDPDFENRGFEKIHFDSDANYQHQSLIGNDSIFGVSQSERVAGGTVQDSSNWPMTMDTDNLIEGVTVTEDTNFSQVRMPIYTNENTRVGSIISADGTFGGESRYLGQSMAEAYRRERLLEDGGILEEQPGMEGDEEIIEETNENHENDDILEEYAYEGENIEGEEPFGGEREQELMNTVEKAGTGGETKSNTQQLLDQMLHQVKYSIPLSYTNFQSEEADGSLRQEMTNISGLTNTFVSRNDDQTQPKSQTRLANLLGPQGMEGLYRESSHIIVKRTEPDEEFEDGEEIDLNALQDDNEDEEEKEGSQAQIAEDVQERDLQYDCSI